VHATTNWNSFRRKLKKTFHCWWHFVQWHFVLWHFVLWHFVLWHFVPWHFVQWHFVPWHLVRGILSSGILSGHPQEVLTSKNCLDFAGDSARYFTVRVRIRVTATLGEVGALWVRLFVHRNVCIIAYTDGQMKWKC